MSAKKFQFTEEQKKQIKEAIIDLEAASSGEVVPFYTYRSDAYGEARWKLATISAILGAVFLGIASYYWWLPFTLTPLEDAIYILVLMIIGYLLPILFPSLVRFVINEDSMKNRVFDKATTIFLEEEVFNTRDRTGVLIYISELEHEVIVLADAGINKKVMPQDWENVVKLVVDGIKSKSVDKGIINAIKACKQLLLDNGFTIRPDDTNELSDDLRIN